MPELGESLDDSRPDDVRDRIEGAAKHHYLTTSCEIERAAAGQFHESSDQQRAESGRHVRRWLQDAGPADMHAVEMAAPVARGC
jgi:hypothetical protein